MSRTTLPPKWRKLAEVRGGVNLLCVELGISPSTLWRWAHGELEIPHMARIALTAIAGAHHVDTPCKVTKRPPCAGKEG